MFVQRRADVQVDDRVAAQHDGGLVEEPAVILDLAHAASRTLRVRHDLAVIALAFERVADLDAPAAAVAEIALDLPVRVGHVDHDLLHAVAREMFDQVFQHRLAQDRDHRLGHVLGQRTHARALACSKNHGFRHCSSFRSEISKVARAWFRQHARQPRPLRSTTLPAGDRDTLVTDSGSPAAPCVCRPRPRRRRRSRNSPATRHPWRKGWTAAAPNRAASCLRPHCPDHKSHQGNRRPRRPASRTSSGLVDEVGGQR